MDVARGGLLEGEVLVQSGQKWSFMLQQPPAEKEGKIKSTFIYKLVCSSYKYFMPKWLSSHHK